MIDRLNLLYIVLYIYSDIKKVCSSFLHTETTLLREWEA